MKTVMLPVRRWIRRGARPASMGIVYALILVAWVLCAQHAGWAQNRTQAPAAASPLDSADSALRDGAGDLALADANATASEESNASAPEGINATLPADADATGPEQGNATAPEASNATTPGESNATTPAETNATVPEEINATTPAEANATALETANATIPEEADGTAPVESNATTPEETNATLPEESNATTPAETNATLPVESNATTPEEANATVPEEANATAALVGQETDQDMFEATQDDILYLLSLMTDAGAPFEPERIRDLVAFSVAQKTAPSDYTPANLDGSNGAYGEFLVHAPLAQILRYAFNPELPTYFAYPGIVRLGGWTDPILARQGLADIWEELPDVETPLVFRGVEYEESTPGEAIGAYYRYEVDRLLVLYSYEGMNILVSVSRQRDQSSIGKKGFPVPQAGEWSFFFSGVNGSMSTAANLVDTYVFKSCSINVFIEPEQDRAMTRMCLFKWIQAGGGIFTDMAGSADIRQGFAPYASTFRRILECPFLPPPEDVAANMAKIEALSDEELRERMRPIAERMLAALADDPAIQSGEFADVLSNGAYVNGMGREEMQSELFKEYLREIVR